MRRFVALLLCCAAVAGLSGCSLFDRSYSTVTNHQEQSASDENAGVLRAETYADLVSCVQHFVSMGQTSGTVHVYKYSGDIEADLRAATAEVRNEDPLGAYALKDISYRYSRIVSYYECTFTFAYRRTVQDMASIVNVFGTAAIRERMRQTLSEFNNTLTLRTSAYYADRSFLYALAREAYYSSPETALGYPGISISVYPETGEARIAEITFTYDNWSRDTLLHHKQAVNAAVVQLAGQDSAADETVAWQLYSRLTNNTVYDSEGKASVYNALCLGRSNSEGIALGYYLLCRQAGIECLLVQGTLNGSPHWWNMIRLEGVYWMVDATRQDSETTFLYADTPLSQLGYNWSMEDYPACGEQPAG